METELELAEESINMFGELSQTVGPWVSTVLIIALCFVYYVRNMKSKPDVEKKETAESSSKETSRLHIVEIHERQAVIGQKIDQLTSEHEELTKVLRQIAEDVGKISYTRTRNTDLIMDQSVMIKDKFDSIKTLIRDRD